MRAQSQAGLRRSVPGAPERGRPVEAYLRLRTLPAEQAQVDWGHFGHLVIGRARRSLMAFVMVLGYSRQMFLRFSLYARTTAPERVPTGRRRGVARLGGPESVRGFHRSVFLNEARCLDNLAPALGIAACQPVQLLWRRGCGFETHLTHGLDEGR